MHWHYLYTEEIKLSNRNITYTLLSLEFIRNSYFNYNKASHLATAKDWNEGTSIGESYYS